MRIFDRSANQHYAKRHGDVRDDLLASYAAAEQAVWKSPAEVRRQFPRASVLANNRIVFDIGGNRYRLIVSISFAHAAAYVKFFGTAAEYDRIDASTVDHTGVIHGKAKS